MPSPEPQNGIALPPLKITEADRAAVRERYPLGGRATATRYREIVACRERQLLEALNMLGTHEAP